METTGPETAESNQGEQTASQVPCAVCLHPMSLRSDGAISIHGPVGHHCSGSGKPLSTVVITLRVSTSYHFVTYFYYH